MFRQHLPLSKGKGIRSAVVALILVSICVTGVNGPATRADAATGCTSGTVTTSSLNGYLYSEFWENLYPNMLQQPDRNIHNFTRVTFSADGQNDAQCTWVAPAGIKGGKLLVVGGGGGGGSYRGGGGGGGGVYNSRSTTFVAGTTYDVVVGRGGNAPSSGCATSCNGENGAPSSFYSRGQRIASASGGGGGGGNTAPAVSVSCSEHDACGGGGGGSAPANGVDVGAVVAGAGGFRAPANSGLAFTGDGGSGAQGARVNSNIYTSGGGGGASSTNSSPAIGDDRIRTMGASGRPLPIDRGSEGYRYGAGGGGSASDYLGGFGNYGGTSLEWGSYHQAANRSAGGRGAAASYVALNGVDGFGGGGGGGGPSVSPPQWNTNYVQGARGGAGTVSIFFLQQPQISGGQEIISHPYGSTTSSSSFRATGGNRELIYGTSTSTPVTYAWSIRDSDGQIIPGVSMTSSGVVTVGESVPVGTVRGIVRATDGAGSYGSMPVSIVIAKGQQQPLVFTSTTPVDRHIGGDPYQVTFSGGSGSSATRLSIDDSSTSICSVESTVQGVVATFKNIGTCRLNLDRLGDDNYFDAAQVQQVIQVTARSSQAALVLTGIPPTAINRGESITLGITGGSGTGSYTLGVAAFSETVCSVAGNVVTTLSLGNCVISANRAADYNFEPAIEVMGSFRVVAGRTLALSQPLERVFQYNGNPVITTVGASVSDGIPFTTAFTVVGGESICSFGHPSRYELAFTGVGTCTIVVEENDNTFSYTRSPEEKFYVVAAGDVSNPTIESVEAPNHIGRFNVGSVIVIAMRFNERVVVTGSPKLLLETGATNRYASYTRGSYTDTLVFSYTVQSGDTSAVLDYVSTDSLELNSGFIKDFSSNNAVLSLPQPGAGNSLSGTSSISVGAIPTPTTTVPPVITTTTTSTTTVPPRTITEPSAVMVVPTADGFKFAIDEFDPTLSYLCTPSAGSAFVWFAQELGLGRVQGIAPGESATVSITASANGQVSNPGVIGGTALGAAHQPIFGTVARTIGGFTASITNFDSRYTYLVTDGVGAVDSTTGLLTVSGLSSGESRSVTVGTSRAEFAVGSASVVGASLIFAAATTVPSSTTPPSVVNQPSIKSVTPTFKIKRGKSIKLRSLALLAGMSVPSRSQVTARVSAKTAKVCAASKTVVKAKKKGTCSVAVTVKRKSGKSSRLLISLIVR